jgi:hypothetical protein
MTRYKMIKKRPKNGQKLICRGGVKIIKNRPRGPGTPKTEFFEILQFSTKAPPLSTPKIDPHKWPYWKTHSPQIGCAFAPMGGVKKVTFWGVGGRTARTEKCRHYYIAIFGFRGSKMIDFS